MRAKEVTAADFTFEVLRSGPGRMVCYDLTGFPGERPWSVECTSSDANLPRASCRIERSRRWGPRPRQRLGEGDRRAGLPVLSSSGTGGIRDLVVAAGKEGTRELSEVGSIWYNLRGDQPGHRHLGTRLSACRTSRRSKWDCRMFAERGRRLADV